MTVHLDIPFETLVELIEQLPAEQQNDLLLRLQKRAQGRKLTVDEKMRLLRAAQIDVTVNQEPSPRREDWYDDDGR
jgi:hypothetical protein